MREIRTSGSTRGMWKRGTERLYGPLLNYRATSLLYAKPGVRYGQAKSIHGCQRQYSGNHKGCPYRCDIGAKPKNVNSWTFGFVGASLVGARPPA